MPAKIKIQPAEAPAFEVEIANTATIGRSKENTISLHFSPHTSRQHAIIRCHNSYEYQIMDLGSRNGTFVDGRRVITPITLRHGSVIRITNNELVFEQVEAAAGDAAAAVTLASGTDHLGESSDQVALMVCDLRGFSTVSEELDEEMLARSLGDWFRNVGNTIQQAGGTIDKFLGDAVLAYWSHSHLRGGEARAALDVAGKLMEIAQKTRWPNSANTPFRLAVALHYGVVTCGNIGLVAQRDATIIGDAVNTVFRLEATMKSLGHPVVISEDFAQCLGESGEAFADLGVHQLKGKNQPIRIFGVPHLV